MATLGARASRGVFTIEQRKAKREGKILIDFMRNGYALTSVAPYSVRARPRGPVATPLHLDELSDASTRPDRWTLRTVIERVQRDGDPWQADLDKVAQTLTAGAASARRRLGRSLTQQYFCRGRFLAAAEPAAEQPPQRRSSRPAD